MEKLFEYLAQQEQAHLEELFTLLRQKSISATGEGIPECAGLLAEIMRKSGIEHVQLYPTAGHPIVYGDVLADCPTLLVYGHYDVQPVEPLELWDTDPFEPVIRDGRLFCRGCSDDKAQLYAHIKGMEAVLKIHGRPKVNVKYLFEGEEEIGSPHLKEFIRTHIGLLQCDACIYSDGCYHDSGHPMLLLGVKGTISAEITIKTAERETHSMRAAAVPSAAWRMVNLLHTLKGEDGTVKIDRFYEHVRPITPLEKETCAKIPFDHQKMLDFYGVSAFIKGRVSDDYYYNMVFEPTCNISGLKAGYVGKEAKGIVPNTATVRLDMKLVPEQTIGEIQEKLLSHLQRHGFGDAVVRFSQGGFEPCWTPINDFYVQVAKEAVQKGFGEDPILLPSAAGGAPHYLFADYLGVNTIEIPYASADQNNHAPNERMLLSGFFAGIRTSAALILCFRRMPAPEAT